MDEAALAQQALTIIAPALPYLTQAAGAALEGAATKVGEEGWAAAQRLWGWVKDRLLQSDGQDAVNDLTTNPADEEARAVLAFKLRKLFAKDTALAAQVADFFQKEGVIQKIKAEQSRLTRVAQHSTGGGFSDQQIDAKEAELTDVIQSKR